MWVGKSLALLLWAGLILVQSDSIMISDRISRFYPAGNGSVGLVRLDGFGCRTDGIHAAMPVRTDRCIPGMVGEKSAREREQPLCGSRLGSYRARNRLESGNSSSGEADWDRIEHGSACGPHTDGGASIWIDDCTMPMSIS